MNWKVLTMARMTNVEIVSMAWAELVSNGTISEAEEIHTFAKWRELGYSVRRGEKCIVKLTIWKHTAKEKTLDNGETVTDARMFMKTAAFFQLRKLKRFSP